MSRDQSAYCGTLALGVWSMGQFADVELGDQRLSKDS